MASPVLFSTGAAPSSGQSRNLIEFKAGKMELRGKMVHPLKKSGIVYLHQSPDDDLMHFCWKDRQTGVVEDDLILFPDDCEFKHVTQCTTGRVYVLKMKSSNRKMFFWMQESKADKDEEYCNKINEYLNHPPTPTRRGGGGGGMNDLANDSDIQALLHNMNGQQIAQLLNSASGGGSAGASSLASLLSATAARAGGTPSTGGSRRDTRPNVTDFNDILSSLRGPATSPTQTQQQTQQQQSQQETREQVSIDLSSVLTVDSLKSLLENEEFMSQVGQHLPNTATTPEPNVREEFVSTVRSPQFRSALSQFCAALQSGQLGPLVAQFGLSEACVYAANSGNFETFVKAFEDSQKSQTAATASAMETDSSGQNKNGPQGESSGK